MLLWSWQCSSSTQMCVHHLNSCRACTLMQALI